MKKKIIVFLFAFLVQPLLSEESAQRLSFGGYSWIVKESCSPVGPGPNLFSRRSIQMREESPLIRLIISGDAPCWTSGEIYTADLFGYGEFVLTAAIPSPLDSRIVFGFFLYNEQAPPHFNEIDFEVSSWGAPERNSFQFTVQPYRKEGNNDPFFPERSEKLVRIRIIWMAHAVRFILEAPDGAILHEWMYEGEDVPAETQCRVHLNLWMFEGASPAGDGQRSVEIHDFSYRSLEK